MNTLTKEEQLDLIDPMAICIVNRAISLALEGVLRPESQIASEHGLSVHKVKRILATPEVKQFLAFHLENLMKESFLDKITLIEEIKKMAFSNISDFGEYNGKRMVWYSWEDVDKSKLSCIEAVSSSVNKYGDVEYEMKLFSKEKALTLLTKMYEMVTNKSEITVKKEDHKPGFFDSIEAEYEVRDGTEDNGTEREAEAIYKSPEESEI